MSQKKKSPRATPGAFASAPAAPVHAPAAAQAWAIRQGIYFAVLGTLGVLLGIGIWSANQPTLPVEVARTAVEPSAPAVAQSTATATVAPLGPTAPTGSAAAALIGQWIRTDGDYILDLKSMDANGNLDAAYLNPKPIHVAKATATQTGNVTHVFVELRDVNYPGSTYDLRFDPITKQLSGVYFQAVQQQRFEVSFTRAP